MPHRILAAVVLALAMSAAPAKAANFTFTGNFVADNDVAVFGFVIGAPSVVTMFSSSWICGDCGFGFDPMLGLWDSAGNPIQFQDDGGIAGITDVDGTDYSHGVWDTYFTSGLLAAGSYLATISQYSNFPIGGNLSNGFNFDGNPNFTFDLGFGAQAMFNGVWSGIDARTSFWRFHILNVEQATPPSAVPEPATLLLFGTGLAAAVVRRRTQGRK